VSWGALQHGLAVVLVGAAVLLALLGALGLLVMHDAWQRLHFVAPPSTLGAALLTLAIALESGAKAALKPLLVTVLLTALNGVVTHALARAAYVRQHRRWPPKVEARA
jgi:multicomponent Na+:H+ antiporter subunit G